MISRFESNLLKKAPSSNISPDTHAAERQVQSNLQVFGGSIVPLDEITKFPAPEMIASWDSIGRYDKTLNEQSKIE